MDKRHKKEIEEALAPAKIIYAAKAETVDDFQQDDFFSFLRKRRRAERLRQSYRHIQ